MKNLKMLFCLATLLVFTRGFAQQNEEDEQKGRFKKENIFLGTSLNLGLANRSFNVGLNPEEYHSTSIIFRRMLLIIAIFVSAILIMAADLFYVYGL